MLPEAEEQGTDEEREAADGGFSRCRRAAAAEGCQSGT